MSGADSPTKDPRKIRVLVLYNEPALPASHPEAESEQAVMAAVDFVAEQLADRAFDVSRLPAGNDVARLRAEIIRRRPEVVVNLFEGLAASPYTEAAVANQLADLRVAFTGSSGRALALARNKPFAKRRLKRAGLPTPRWRVVDSLPIAACPFRPAIAKPAHEDASIGIDQHSVVTDADGLDVRVRELQARYGPSVLVEEYVPGREFSLAVIERPSLQVLPVIEFVFESLPDAPWPILTYDSKWQPGSIDYEASRAKYGADLTAAARAQLERLAKRAFRAIDCRDYARVDFRVAPDGRPYILEVNPNPDLSPTACFSGALRSAGISTGDFLALLTETARRRNDRTARDVGAMADDRLACA